MTRPESTSALAWTSAPARVTGAVPPCTGAGECTMGSACSAMYSSLSTAVTDWRNGEEGSV